MYQVLRPDGTVALPEVAERYSPELLKRIYSEMVAGRTLDRRMMSLQRQGRMGTFAPMEGQEAVCIGSALAFGAGDWVFPSYREHATVLNRGLPLRTFLEFYRGHGYVNWDVRRFRVGLYTIPISTHLPTRSDRPITPSCEVKRGSPGCSSETAPPRRPTSIRG